tara:strand:+ start:18 stop:794 length:777 start_codon:yes stop_codon:yes gene_type:complete
MSLTNTKSMLTCGCSFTAGTGLEFLKDDPKLWINQLAFSLDYKLTNIAQPGTNNDWIFVETMLELSKHQYDVVVVAWSVIPRINVNLGLELYSTSSKLKDEFTINTNLKTFTKKWQKQVGDKFLEAYSYHWDLLKLVKYVNILDSMHKNVYFVNTYGPWPNNFFTKQEIKDPSNLDQFTQDLLNVETRDDIEIFQLYNMIHKQYNDAGTINSKLWLNLYDSFLENKLDNASSTDRHPGYLSNDYYTKMLYPILKEKLQ